MLLGLPNMKQINQRCHIYYSNGGAKCNNLTSEGFWDLEMLQKFLPVHISTWYLQTVW